MLQKLKQFCFDFVHSRMIIMQQHNMKHDSDLLVLGTDKMPTCYSGEFVFDLHGLSACWETNIPPVKSSDSYGHISDGQPCGLPGDSNRVADVHVARCCRHTNSFNKGGNVQSCIVTDDASPTIILSSET